MIEMTAHYNALGDKERLDFKWIGGDTVGITLMLLSTAECSVLKYDRFPFELGDRFKFGPFKLRVLEVQFWTDTVIAIRDRGFVTDLRYLWHRFGRLFDIAYRRLIVTLAIWNLADCEAGVIPTWRDVHALRRVEEGEAQLKKRQRRRAKRKETEEDGDDE
jgi:hypothetical protein